MKSQQPDDFLPTAKAGYQTRGWVLWSGFSLALLVFVWAWQFFPADRQELGPVSDVAGRAFTTKGPTGDTELYVSDWPWTLFEPQELSLNDLSDFGAKIGRSGDGTVVATHANEDARPLEFISAYDFSSHRAYTRPVDLRVSDPGLQSELNGLMAQRGGYLRSWKKGRLQPPASAFPVWVWLLTGGLILVSPLLSGHLRKYW